MSKSTPDNTLEIYKGPDGALFAIPYKAATARMRNEASDPASVALLAFKIHGSHSGRFLGIAEAVREHFRCDCIVAVPGAGVALNSVQLIAEDETPVILRPRYARPNRHNAKEEITLESETVRVAVDWQTEAKRIPRVLLLDDVARTGTTLAVFAEMLIKEGVAKEVIRFSFGRSECRFKREATLQVAPRPDLPDLPALSGAIGGKDDGPRSEGLERLRQLRGDLLQVELDRARGTLIERDSVHLAFAQVVAIVRGKLLQLGPQGVAALTNRGAAEIERWLERWARDAGEEFQSRCGEVALIPAEIAAARLDVLLAAVGETDAVTMPNTTRRTPGKKSRRTKSKKRTRSNAEA